MSEQILYVPALANQIVMEAYSHVDTENASRSIQLMTILNIQP